MNDFDLRKFLVENKLTPQSLLNGPEDDEYNIDASPEWNARELRVNDEIFISDFKPETISSFRTWAKWLRNQPPYIDVIDNGLTISRIDFKSKNFTVHVNGTDKYITYFFNELDPNKVTLVSESITEQDDYEEFTIDSPSEEWDAKELTVGSQITPDMWTKYIKDLLVSHDPKTFSLIMDPNKIPRIEYIEYDDKIFAIKGNSYYGEYLRFGFKSLDPNKAYIKGSKQDPNLFEQDEDEFDVTPSEEWNVQELTVGSTITPDMWTEKAKNDFNNFDDNYYFIAFSEPVKISDISISGLYFDTIDKNGNESRWLFSELDPNKAYIKSSQQDPNLFESDEDEFTVEPSKEWNVQELTVGSVITPDMWSEEAKNDYTNVNQEKYAIAFSQNVVIKQIHYDGYTFTTVPENDEDGEMVPWYSTELDPTKAYIKGSEQDPNLFESDEDEFDNPIEASPEWGAQELTIGSRVTPDMWNKEAYDYFSKRGPKWILKPEVNAVIYEIEEDGNNVTWIKLLLKPKKENPKTRFLTVTHWLNSEQLNNVHIVPPLNESDEDDFDVTPSEEWNAQELNVGDIITPDMWHDWVREDFPYTRRKYFRIVKIGSGLYTYNDAYVETLSKDKSRVVGSKKWIPGHWLNPTKAILVPQN